MSVVCPRGLSVGHSSVIRPRRPVVALALVVDILCGEPPACLHPVVWIGRATESLAGPAPASPGAQLVHGAVRVALVGGIASVASGIACVAARRLPEPAATLAEAGFLKTFLSVRGLVEAAGLVRDALHAGDLERARHEARALVSRDTSDLGVPLLASAAVESVAENAVDSIVAPLFSYALAGLPGAALYRTVNTMDAMIGYRGAYEYLGKTAARLDDLLNVVPARIGALLLVAGAALVGESPAGALAGLWADRGRTASPNAGWPMSAMAGALGVRLTKPDTYCLGLRRPDPDVKAIDRAIRIVLAATVLTVPLAVALAGGMGRRR